MPTPDQILHGLALAANNFYLVSIFWHLLVLLFFVLLFSGKKFSSKQVMAFLTLPLSSVAIVAALTSNPFNGIVFGVLTVILWITIYRAESRSININWDITSLVGLILVLFGFFYPHFLEGKHYLHYLYAAPTGLIPCPTLSLVIGITLLFHGFHHKKWMWYLACVGMFYGLFGVFRLKVHLDWVLVAGALTLLIFASRILKIKEISE
jgi:hypothetical protein